MYPKNLEQYVPPEFDLTKYQTAYMSLFDWAYYLSFRSVFRAFDLSDEDLEEYNTENIRIGATPRDNSSVLEEGDAISVVREITCFQVLAVGDELDKKMNAKSLYVKTSKNAFKDRSTHEQLGKYISEVELYYDMFMPMPAWLEVDLTCSEKEIKAAFEIWLKQIMKERKSQKSRKRREYKLKEFSEATLRRWHDSKILAYLDLEAWNYLQGNKVTSKQYGDILFPEYKNQRDNTQYVNDTLKPLAEHLTDGDLHMRMRKIYIDTNRQK